MDKRAKTFATFDSSFNIVRALQTVCQHNILVRVPVHSEQSELIVESDVLHRQ